MGEGAERIDLDAATLKGRPGAPHRQSGVSSMFGDKRWVRVLGAGEENVAAVEALLEAPTGNPVILYQAL